MPKIKTRSCGPITDGNLAIEVDADGERNTMRLCVEGERVLVPHQQFDPPLRLDALEAIIRHAKYLVGGWVEFDDGLYDDDPDEDEE